MSLEGSRKNLFMHLCMAEKAPDKPANDNDGYGKHGDGRYFD